MLVDNRLTFAEALRHRTHERTDANLSAAGEVCRPSSSPANSVLAGIPVNIII